VGKRAEHRRVTDVDSHAHHACTLPRKVEEPSDIKRFLLMLDDSRPQKHLSCWHKGARDGSRGPDDGLVVRRVDIDSGYFILQRTESLDKDALPADSLPHRATRITPGDRVGSPRCEVTHAVEVGPPLIAPSDGPPWRPLSRADRQLDENGGQTERGTKAPGQPRAVPRCAGAYARRFGRQYGKYLPKTLRSGRRLAASLILSGSFVRMARSAGTMGVWARRDAHESSDSWATACRHGRGDLGFLGRVRAKNSQLLPKDWLVRCTRSQ
jgi:hypothetical protein